MKNMKTKEEGTTSILKRIMYVTIIGLLMIQFTSCTKTDDSSEKASLSVQLTDAPANYDAVMIDVQGVEIKGESDSSVMLNTAVGMYNLLDLSNGVDTLIATGDIEPGTVSQIRLILGTNNFLTLDGVDYPLSTPSAQQSGLKLQIHQTFEAGVAYSILLDFDASQSIILKGNNEYQLKPVIRTIDAAISGSIKGSITPVGTIATVTASSDGVIYYSSVTNEDGNFLIAGLPVEIYEIIITPELPLLPVTITEQEVSLGTSTDLGIIILL
jgi:hypothetical protein